MSVSILNLYKSEVRKQKELINKINNDKKKVEERLLESDQYIGKVNVQLMDIKSIFNSIDSYPQTKTEFKKAFNYFGERIIGIANSNWALIRIIDYNSQKTISEHLAKRDHSSSEFPHISNKMIIENEPITALTTIFSRPKNMNVLVFCVLPLEKISNNDRLFIQAMIDEITKLFVIVNSTYFKNESVI